MHPTAMQREQRSIPPLEKEKLAKQLGHIFQAAVICDFETRAQTRPRRGQQCRLKTATCIPSGTDITVQVTGREVHGDDGLVYPWERSGRTRRCTCAAGLQRNKHRRARVSPVPNSIQGWLLPRCSTACTWHVHVHPGLGKEAKSFTQCVQ